MKPLKGSHAADSPKSEGGTKECVLASDSTNWAGGGCEDQHTIFGKITGGGVYSLQLQGALFDAVMHPEAMRPTGTAGRDGCGIDGGGDGGDGGGDGGDGGGDGGDGGGSSGSGRERGKVPREHGEQAQKRVD